MATVLWGTEPDEHDYPAAEDYLALLAKPGAGQRNRGGAEEGADRVQEGQGSAARITLGVTAAGEPTCARGSEEIKKGKQLSPILVVRGDVINDVALQIADGYHRVCASYHTDENTDIPVKIVAIGR